jgi:hypothetical protein
VKESFSRNRLFILYCVIGASGVTPDFLSYSLLRMTGIRFVALSESQWHRQLDSSRNRPQYARPHFLNSVISGQVEKTVTANDQCRTPS